jgi:glyoxylase-like metal-dependent hydrolase (beta-lactamase superfamily II)
MRVHHLNCGTFCPFGGRLMDGVSRGAIGHLVCHCLLVEMDRAGLVLVDTGLGLRDMREPFPRLSRLYANLLNIRFDPERSAVRQVERLGFAPRDVRHIVLTHLDFDHAGGLEDFPGATVHLLEVEADAALRRRRGFVAERRYRPQQWGDTSRWRRYRAGGGGEPWFGFEAVRDLAGLPPEILLVPLVGHTFGHAGVAIRADGGWLLNAGDAYFYRNEVGSEGYHCPPGLRAYQRLMEADREARLRNQARLRELSLARPELRMMCSHDPVLFERMAAQAAAGPRHDAPAHAAAE